jgi:hypothetical protein
LDTENSKYDAAPVNFYREAKQRYEEVRHQRVESADQTFSRLRKSNAESERGLVALEHNVRPWWRKA